MKHIKKFNEEFWHGQTIFEVGHHYKATNSKLTDTNEFMFIVTSLDGDDINARIFKNVNGGSFDDVVLNVNQLDKDGIQIEDLGELSEEQEEKYYNQ